ncbi:hypothetical protein [Spirilliplanes yamanashiensis]|uniref:Uncharacterized protein n=1 Tax=Spirilliplanes yamanashiensis TaxID=42233 RepID=A0A8J4DME2_9ACTN|nr:hypothetical protein [Spirilliplanes yamanashiensis]MDP9818528.1 hypothetical protein [Spirilliplanes yamanashiensis]GIJ06343.1 hypothetical protein Sya03_56950 [Spirilliplanes yamanashiensis]
MHRPAAVRAGARSQLPAPYPRIGPPGDGSRHPERGLKEVGAFIDKGGNNFWGVEVHKIGGKQYVLASDRDYGLYIFKV